MKKLFAAILFLITLNASAQTISITPSFRINTPVNSKDSMAYIYTGKIGGYSWLYNAEYIRANFAPIAAGTGYVPYLGANTNVNLNPYNITAVRHFIPAGHATYGALELMPKQRTDSLYQPLNVKLTSIAALANSAGVLTNNGSGVFSYVAPSTGTVTSITPGWSFTSTTPITTTGSLITDSTKVLTVTRYKNTQDTLYNKYVQNLHVSGSNGKGGIFIPYNNNDDSGGNTVPTPPSGVLLYSRGNNYFGWKGPNGNSVSFLSQFIGGNIAYILPATNGATLATINGGQTFSSANMGSNIVYRTPTGTAGTDSIAVKVGSTGKMGAIAANYYLTGTTGILNQLTQQTSSNFNISDTGIVGKHFRVGGNTSYVYPTSNTTASFNRDGAGSSLVISANPNTGGNNNVIGGFFATSGQPLSSLHGEGAGYLQMVFVDTLYNADPVGRAISNRAFINTGSRSEGLTIFSDAAELAVPNPNRIRGIKLSVQKPVTPENPSIFYPDFFIAAPGFDYTHRSYGIGMGTERVNKVGTGKALTIQTDQTGTSGAKGIALEMLTPARNTSGLVLGSWITYGDTIVSKKIASIDMVTSGTDNATGDIQFRTRNAGVEKLALTINSFGNTKAYGNISSDLPTGQTPFLMKAGSGTTFSMGQNAGTGSSDNNFTFTSSVYGTAPLYTINGTTGVMSFQLSPTVPTPTGSNDAIPKGYGDATYLLKANPAFTGMLTGPAATLSGIVNVAADIRATAQVSPTSGVGTEIAYDGTNAILRGFDRSGGLYKPVYINENLLIGGGTGAASAFSGNLTSLNTYSTSATPTISAGSGAGSGPTISIAGNNQDGVITLTTGTSPTSSATIFTVTLSGGFSYPTACTPVTQLRTTSSGTLTFTTGSTTGSTWQLLVNGAALNASQTYSWFYHNGGY